MLHTEDDKRQIQYKTFRCSLHILNWWSLE